MKRKQTVCLVILLVCGIVLLSGCDKKETKEPIELTLMHGWGGTLKSCKVMQEIYHDFSKQNPDINLKSIPYSSNEIAVKEANDRLAVGEVPDILCTNGASYYISNAVKCGQVMDLMPYIEADSKWKSQINPAVFETWETKDGHLYTVPDVLEVSGYWMNQEYLRSAGIVDDKGAARIPKTWTEFFEMTEQLQNWIDETGRDISVFALDEVQVVEFVFLARMAGARNSGLEAASDLGNPATQELLQKTKEDLKKMRTYSLKVSNIENARQYFKDGRSVIYFNGVWEAAELEDSTIVEQFDYANYPTDSGQSLSYISASSGYVLARQEDERRAEATIRFLKYMLSEEVQKKIAVETGQAPLDLSIDRKEIRQSSPLLGRAIDRAEQADIQIKTMRSIWSDEQIETVRGYWKNEMWED